MVGTMKTVVAAVIASIALVSVSNGQAQRECGVMPELDVYQACPTKGACDSAGERDTWDHTRLFDEDNKMKIRVRMHVFADDLVLPDWIVNNQRDKLVADFAQYNIEPVVTWQRVLDPNYFQVDTEAEISAMKSTYAISPSTLLNVYITDVGSQLNFKGQGFLPWNSAGPMTSAGGIVVDKDAIGSFKTTLTHEVGHNLGLWHIHHGWDEEELYYHGRGDGCIPGMLEPCNCYCFEAIDSSNCDSVGDFCCDTPATAEHTTCGEAPTGYPCASQPFTSDWTNFMGYAPDGPSPTAPPCRNHFSTQQTRRMLCWTCDAVQGWVDGQDCDNNGTVDECDLARGDASDCDQDGLLDVCEPMEKGACCLPQNTCQDGHTQCSCDAVGGTFAGQFSKCSSTNCLVLAQ